MIKKTYQIIVFYANKWKIFKIEAKKDHQSTTIKNGAFNIDIFIVFPW